MIYELKNTVEAVQLKWNNWSEICEFVPDSCHYGGCYVNRTTGETDANPIWAEEDMKIGFRLRNDKYGTVLAVENDWIVKVGKNDFHKVTDSVFQALRK